MNKENRINSNGVITSGLNNKLYLLMIAILFVFNMLLCPMILPAELPVGKRKYIVCYMHIIIVITGFILSTIFALIPYKRMSYGKTYKICFVVYMACLHLLCYSCYDDCFLLLAAFF